jgi:hypothetical protein
LAGSRFDGGTTLVFSDQNLPAKDSARSLLLWLKATEVQRTPIFLRYGEMRPGSAFYLVIFGRDHPIKRSWEKLVIGNPGGGGGPSEPAGKTVVVDGKWHHAALSYDGKGTAILYIDGKQDLVFKRRYSTTLLGEGFIGEGYRGFMDDIIIVNRALSQTEIREYYISQKLKKKKG